MGDDRIAWANVGLLVAKNQPHHREVGISLTILGLR